MLFTRQTLECLSEITVAAADVDEEGWLLEKMLGLVKAYKQILEREWHPLPGRVQPYFEESWAVARFYAGEAGLLEIDEMLRELWERPESENGKGGLRIGDCKQNDGKGISGVEEGHRVHAAGTESANGRDRAYDPGERSGEVADHSARRAGFEVPEGEGAGRGLEGGDAF